MGDKPTEVDCALFGMLTQVVWSMPDPSYSELITGKNNFKSVNKEDEILELV